MSSEQADASKTPKRPHGSREQKKTLKRKNAKPHNKSKAKTDNKAKHVRHTDYDTNLILSTQCHYFRLLLFLLSKCSTLTIT